MMTDIATHDDVLSAFAAAAEQLSTGAKPILKFQKGDWLLGQEAEELKPGTRLALNMLDAEHGWVRWKDGKPAERKMTRIAARVPIPSRHELGHHDEELWDKDGDGRPRDPCKMMLDFPARELEGERREVVVSGGSRGWEGCCKALLTDFASSARQNPGKTPIVELGSGRYQHKTYGMVKVPALPIVTWLTEEELVNGTPGIGQKKKVLKRF
jgi:hypothetical protein